MAAKFPGFPTQALAFFRQLARNNSREWFAAHKAQYEQHVLAPAVDLCSLVIDDLRGFAADHVGEPKKSLFRIYRDTRFSKDKTPYKTHVAAVFPHGKLGRTTCAGFYFCVSHECVEIAAGMYMPGPEELIAVRNAIANDDGKAFRKLLAARGLRSQAGDLLGTKLARVPRGYDTDHPAADLLRMKQWYFDVTLSASAALAPSIRKEITTRFRAMAPVVQYLNNAALAARDSKSNPDAIPKRPAPMF